MKDLKDYYSVVMLFLGAGLGAFSTFILQVFLARSLGVTSYGYFSSFYSVVLIVSPLAGFGIGQFLLRSFGREGQSALKWLNSAREYLALTSLLAFSIPFFLVGYSYDFFFKVCLGSVIFVVLAVEIISVKAQLEGAYNKLSFWQSLPPVARLLCVASTYLLCGGKLNADFSALAIFLSFLVVYIVGGKDISGMLKGDISLKSNAGSEAGILQRSLYDVFKGAWPFGAASFLFLAYFQASIALAAFLFDEEAAGLVSVCVTLLTAVYLAPTIIYQKFLAPKISYWTFHDLSKLKEVYTKGACFMAFLGVGGALCLYGLSDFVVSILFGDEYKKAVPILMIMILAIPARFIGANFGAFFLLEREILTKVLILFFVVVANFCISFMLHKKFGVYAIAYALVASELLLALLFFLASRRYIIGRMV